MVVHNTPILNLKVFTINLRTMAVNISKHWYNFLHPILVKQYYFKYRTVIAEVNIGDIGKSHIAPILELNYIIGQDIYIG
jgi:hypothetical protein